MGSAIHYELQYGTVLLGFPGVSVVKNLPANAGDARDASSVPQLRRFPIVGNGNTSILFWRIPWMEEPGG